MAKNRPRRVLVELTPAPDPEARLEVLEALLAGGGLPFSRRGETPVAGHKAVGEDGDEPLPWGVHDAAAHHPRRVASQSHAQEDAPAGRRRQNEARSRSSGPRCYAGVKSRPGRF